MLRQLAWHSLGCPLDAMRYLCRFGERLDGCADMTSLIEFPHAKDDLRSRETVLGNLVVDSFQWNLRNRNPIFSRCVVRLP